MIQLHNLMRASLLLVICVFLTSCSVQDTPMQVQRDIEDPLLEYLVDSGFDRKEIIDRGDLFIIEGDIVVTKNDIRRRLEKGLKPAQRRGSYLVSTPNVTNITVNVSQVENAGWADAIRAAIPTWNNVSHSQVNFTETTGSPDITVEFASLGGSIADANLPSSGGSAGWRIRIDPDFDYYSSSDKQSVMTHELGHTIGFHHTNTSEGTHVTGTPTSDSGSVMNTPHHGRTTVSLWDRHTSRHFYGSSFSFSGLSVSFDANNHPKPSWSSVSEASSYNVHLCVKVYTDFYGWITNCEDRATNITSTSFTDTTHTYSGTYYCEPEYLVTANFGPAKELGESNEVLTAIGPLEDECSP